MYKSLKILAAGALFAATASVASAAPANTMTVINDGVSTGLEQIDYHGKWDKVCRRGPGGWYRINRRGERRSCRQWDGRGRRPDACVSVGPLHFCDY